MCSAELPTGSERARMRYTYDGRKTIDLTIVYPERQTDVPVRMNALRLDKYKEMNIVNLL